MVSELFTLFSSQLHFTSNQACYNNEYEKMRLFEEIPDIQKKIFNGLSLQWLQNLEENEGKKFNLKDKSRRVKESKNLREEGNELFTAKGNKRNILRACSLYNDAIYASLGASNEEMALSFANRGMSLQAFGYYQQAYDDCVWALRLGYPVSLRHKIILRQAFCAIELKNVQSAETHLKELSQLNLNYNCAQQFKQLRNALEMLKQEHLDKKEGAKLEIEVPLNRKSQRIITTEKGRSMIATCFIAKNELIFTEKASAFVAIGDTQRICHQCLKVHFIPFPCLHCRGRVNYCSIKCQEEHATIHQYECPAYRFQLFNHIGIAHLALRIVLDNGIFSIVDKLKTTKKSTAQIWCDLSEGGDIWNDQNIKYAETLRMISHFDKLSRMDIEWYSLVSFLLVVYLKHYTNYFKVLGEKNKKNNWELLTGSLILRHIGQLISNAYTLTTIIPKPLTFLETSKYHMLNDRLWSSPWHLKLGCLNQFANYDDLASLNLPYQSLCNHSCVQSYQPKFSGSYVSVYALRDFNEGDEITNCYDVDYRKAKRSARRCRLKETYYFDCKCEDCLQTDAEDIEFNKFHQYRCNNLNCKKVFVPNIQGKPTLNWWQSDKPNEKINTNIYCTECGSLQNMGWYDEFKQLMYTFQNANSRRRLYDIFMKLENTLLGLNDARGYVAMKLLREWFKLSFISVRLNDQDYLDMIEMAKYLLNLIKAECPVNSTEYVIACTFLWDLIALRKYKCSKADMDEMLFALSVISDDLKIIFLNYYNDYIKDI